MLKPKTQIEVLIDNTKVEVAGRRYEAPHILVIGASRSHLEVKPGEVKVKAGFDELPYVEIHEDEFIKVYREGSRYEVDVLGDRIKEIRDEADGKVISGDLVTIRFEADEPGNAIIVKPPKLERIKAKSLEIKSNASTSLNIIVLPFIVGVMSVSGSMKMVVKQVRDKVEIVSTSRS